MWASCQTNIIIEGNGELRDMILHVSDSNHATATQRPGRREANLIFDGLVGQRRANSQPGGPTATRKRKESLTIMCGELAKVGRRPGEGARTGPGCLTLQKGVELIHLGARERKSHDVIPSNGRLRRAPSKRPGEEVKLSSIVDNDFLWRAPFICTAAVLPHPPAASSNWQQGKDLA
ncbi:hypothetical protein D8B26_005875 [Coccidioides posadasii str. Silveira]|uniref:uncharacterized protein n=1 Tax=Coccidioides posadasii (strain RMSCC 757 / Silveira) TaxID=443226 RepID=UPI001BF1221F|nr:hypothetical protein D8B26_005875 [Coccidioides posadasii str. Silveira]